MNNTRKIATLTLMSLTLLSNTPVLEAKIMTGSVSEKKQTAKVAKLLNQARKSVEKGKNQDAINAYWKILELDSDEAYAYLELGEIYKKIRIYDRSIEMLISGLELGKDELDKDTLCYYYCVLTEAYIATHQQGLANKSLIKAAEIAPRNPMPRKILGDIYLKNNRVANAAKAYRKALELDPNYEPAIKELNDLKLEYGNKLPKEDKDKDYIKKVAVKLADKGTKEEVKETRPLPQEKIQTPKEDDQVPVSYTEDNTNSNENNEDSIEISNETESEKITINDNRPIPLDAKELAKMAEKKKKLKEKENAKKLKTAEDIEKAMAEKEALISSENINSKEKAPKNQQYMEMFLAGNPTEREEAINYFINLGKPGLDEIEELIYDPNPNVRILAVRALPLFDDYKDDVKSILKEALEETSDSELAEEINKALSLL